MKTFIKIISGIIIAVVLIVILALVVLIFFFPNEKVRQIAQEQLSIKLKREVVIEKLNIHLLKGIVLENVKISDRSTFKDGTFVDCKAFYCRYNLIDMLKAVIAARNPEVLKKQTFRIAVVLDSPSIFIKRYIDANKKTVFNFSDLLPEQKKSEEPEKLPQEKVKTTKTPEKKEPPSSVIPKVKSSALPINIEVVEAGLKNAKIEILDTATPKFKEIYSLHDVRLLVSDINIKKNNPMKLNLGFGISVSEFKEGQKTDKDINLDLDVTGKFVLFDKKGILNPEGTLALTLANGKLTGVQFYRELVKEGQNLSSQASSIQKDFIKQYEEVKKAVEQAKKSKEASKYLGEYGSSIDKVTSLADKLEKVDIKFISKAMDLKFLSETLTFDKVTGFLFIKDEKILATNFVMKGQELSANGKGYIGFNQSLDWVVRLLGAKKYNDNVLTSAFANQEGEIVLPVKITGTVTKPVVKFDVDIRKIISSELSKRFGPEVGDLISGKVGVKDLANQAKQLLQEKANQKVEEVKQQAQQELDKAKQEAEKKLEEEKKKQTETVKKEVKKQATDALKKTGVSVPKF